jgi:ABC-2 type transport system permease protein
MTVSATTGYRRAALTIAWRQLHTMLTNPAFLLPSLLMPIFFFTAFAGGLSAVGNSPGFEYPDYTTFQFVFVLLQSAVFGGVFAGFSVAADFESGFARRLLLGVRGRTALIAGYVLAALGRALITWGVVTVVAVLAGIEVSGSGLDLASLLAIAVFLNVAAMLFSAGMAMRLRTMQAGPLIQLPAFLIIMTAPVYVPRDLIEGWVATVADYNPITALLESGRDLIIGAPAETWLALGVGAGLIALMGLWAVRGLRSAEAAG